MSRGAWLGDIPFGQRRGDGLEVLGELASVDQRAEPFDVRPYPNLKGGRKLGFRLPLNASLELIESLPSFGCGVPVTCSFRE